MPQTTSERAARWPGGDREAIQFLKKRGFELTRLWTWITPPGRDIDSLDYKERDAIKYLIEEWDFGGAEERF